MTLATRNIILKTLFAVSLCFIAMMIIFAALSLHSGTFSVPRNAARPFPFFTGNIAVNPNMGAVIAAICILMLYVPILSLKLYLEFEKTKAVELFYFTVFLVSCLTEGLRFIIPFANLWYNYSALLSITERLLFFGRLLAPISFFCAAMLTATNQPQNADRSVIISIIISVGFATIIPINVSRIMSNGHIEFGYHTLFTIISILLVIMTFIAYHFTAWQKNSTEYMRVPFGYIVLFAGYALLTVSDNYICTAAGTGCLIAGTYVYFSSIHKYYEWL